MDNYQIHFYDLVILDIKMPKMDGFELYIKLREKDPKVKICFLTASELFYEEFRHARLQLGEKVGEEYLFRNLSKLMNLLKK